MRPGEFGTAIQECKGGPLTRRLPNRGVLGMDAHVANGFGAVKPHLQSVYVPPSRPRRTRRSPRRHFRNGQRAAVLRALTAAQLYASGAITSIAKAAEGCGSNSIYVKAVTVLLKAENAALLDRVLAGHQPLVEAAQQA